jgi:hypothetical protein
MIGSNNEYTGKVFFVKTVTKVDKKQVDPYFSFKQKVGDKYEEVNKSTAFSGNLEKVETYEREWEGVKSTNVKISVVDGDEKYIADFPFSIVSRSVFNTLLGLESYEGLKFTIYLTKPNAAKGGARYPQISIWQGEQLCKWKYGIEDLPPTKKVRVKGQDLMDTEDVDNFFIEKINEKFSSKNAVKADKKPTAAKKPVEKESPIDNGGDLDPPF